MDKTLVNIHDIVQIVNIDHKWCGCLIYVTDIKSWGVVGFVEMPSMGKAYIRLSYDDIDIIGHASLYIDAEE